MCHPRKRRGLGCSLCHQISSEAKICHFSCSIGSRQANKLKFSPFASWRIDVSASSFANPAWLGLSKSFLPKANLPFAGPSPLEKSPLPPVADQAGRAPFSKTAPASPHPSPSQNPALRWCPILSSQSTSGCYPAEWSLPFVSPRWKFPRSDASHCCQGPDGQDFASVDGEWDWTSRQWRHKRRSGLKCHNLSFAESQVKFLHLNNRPYHSIYQVSSSAMPMTVYDYDSDSSPCIMRCFEKTGPPNPDRPSATTFLK